MKPAISFQIIVSLDDLTKDHISLKEWNKLGISPYLPNLDIDRFLLDSYTLNHLVADLDMAFSSAFHEDGFQLNLKYQAITGDGDGDCQGDGEGDCQEDDAETYLLLDIISNPPLIESQLMNLMELFEDVLADFPRGFTLSSSLGKKIVIFLQPIGIEIPNTSQLDDYGDFFEKETVISLKVDHS